MTNRKLAVRFSFTPSLLGAAGLALGIAAPCLAAAQVHPQSSAGSSSTGQHRVEQRPPAFIENRGQWPDQIRFRLGRGHLSAAVLQDGFALNLVGMENADRKQRAVGLAFFFEKERRPENEGRLDDEGQLRGSGQLQTQGQHASNTSLEPNARPGAVRGLEQTPGFYHFYLGDEPRQWRSDVRGFGRVNYPAVWPGVDVVLREGAGLFEYDLLLAPGADLAQAEIRVEGALSIEVDAEGRLLLATELGPLVHTAPVAWTEDGSGTKVSHPCAFRRIDAERFGFVAAAVPAGQRLVVDPGVVWSTFLGHEDEDLTNSVVRLAGGEVLATGGTYSYEFPMTVGAYDVTLNGNIDAFVTCLSADGAALIFSTFLGGSSADHGTAIALHSDGSLYVAGEALSSNFPTTAGAFSQSLAGQHDGFVAHLDASGASLLHSTYFGSSTYDRVLDMAIDPFGRPTLVGFTTSASFPTLAGSYDTSFGGGFTEAYLTRFTSDLSALDVSTFLGGNHGDSAECLRVLGNGQMIVGGGTYSSDFPVTNGAMQGVLAGGSGDQDGFLLSLDSSGQNLLWSTFYGGTGHDAIHALEVNAQGDCVIAGVTESTDLALGPNPAQGLHGGLTDAFMAFVHPAGSATQLMDSTFFGGTGEDKGQGLALLPSGQIVLAGTTSSTDLPMDPWVFDDDFGKFPNTGTLDLFINRYEADHSLSYSTYFGGAGDDTFSDMVPGGEGTVVFGGYTNSFNLPVSQGAFDVSYDYSGLYDGFVSHFEFLRFPFTYGVGKVHSGGYSAQLSITGFPSFASSSIQIWVDGVLSNSTGLFFVSSTPGVIPFAGGELLSGPPYQRTPSQTVGWLGNGSLQVDISPSMIGTTRYYQYWFADPGDVHGIGLSNGMEVLFYP